MITAVLTYPQIDPMAIRVGSFGISWYALAYLTGFVLAYLMLRLGSKRAWLPIRQQDVGGVTLYLFYGLILGARLAYVLVYNPAFYWEHPLEIPAIWHGGMSFHGGLVGGMFAVWLYCKRYQLNLGEVLDALTLVLPIPLGLGRIANFINGELYGRVSHLPWAMVFPRGGPEPRHPSQLYESLLEGPVYFLILWLCFRRRKFPGQVTALGILTYGMFRFLVEFVRQPDAQLGTVLGPFSMGQILSSLMVLFGLALWIYWQRAFRRGDSCLSASGGNRPKKSPTLK